MSAETLKIKVHRKFLEDIEVCAEKNNMLVEEYILAAIRAMNEKIKGA